VRGRDRRSAGMLGIAWVGGAKSATGNRATRCGCAGHQWGCRHRQQRPFQPRATPCAAAAVWQDPGHDAGEGGQARPRVRDRVALLSPVPPDLPLPLLSPPCILWQPPPSAASGTPAHPSPMRAHPRATVSSRARAPPSPPTVPVGAAAQWRLTGGGTQMPFSAMWTHIRVWKLRVRGHTGRFFLQSYVKRTSGAVSTLTMKGRSSSRRDASGAIKKYVLVAPES